MLADEHIYIIIAQINDKVLDRLRININNFHAHLGTSQLLCHDSSLFQSIDLSVRVDTALKAERSISLQSMTSATLAYPSRIEISTLEQDILRSLIRTTTLSPKHTSDTHRLHSITYSQVPLAQSVFHTIESHKRSTLRHSPYNNLITLNHISIKAMQRLSICHHDIISNVDDIVDRTQADDRETILQPFGTFLDNTILQRQRTIARTSLRSHNTHRNLKLSIIHDKTIARRTMQSSPVAILYQPGIQVARHTIVAASISTVWSDIHLNQIVALQLIVFSSRRTHDSILRQHDDTIMTFTNADFILSTNHAQRLDATQFATLDSKLLVAIIQLRTHDSHDNLLSGSHIGSTTNYLQRTGLRTRRIPLPYLHRTHVHMVAVGVSLASHHLPYPQSFQSTLDSLHLLDTAHLQSLAGKGSSHLVGRQIKVNIVFQPFVRDIHIKYSIMYTYLKNRRKITKKNTLLSRFRKKKIRKEAHRHPQERQTDSSPSCYASPRPTVHASEFPHPVLQA